MTNEMMKFGQFFKKFFEIFIFHIIYAFADNGFSKKLQVN